MVSMGNVWDRTTDVLRGRAGIIAPIATIAIFVPSVVSAAVTNYGGKGSLGTAVLAMFVALGVVIATFWGTLAIMAVATHPATTRGDAQRQATARLLPAIGIVLALSAMLTLFVLPLLVALVGTGIDFTRPDAAANLRNVTLSGGAAAFITFYSLFLIVGGLILSVRLFLLNPTILNERRGLRSIPRSFELTRGLTWKLIGVLVIFTIVVMVPTLAVQAVVGVVVRLVLGDGGIPTAAFLATSAGAAVTTFFSAIAAVFQAQLYVAATERDAAR